MNPVGCGCVSLTVRLSVNKVAAATIAIRRRMFYARLVLICLRGMQASNQFGLPVTRNACSGSVQHIWASCKRGWPPPEPCEKSRAARCSPHSLAPCRRFPARCSSFAMLSLPVGQTFDTNVAHGAAARRIARARGTPSGLVRESAERNGFRESQSC